LRLQSNAAFPTVKRPDAGNAFLEFRVVSTESPWQRRGGKDILKLCPVSETAIYKGLLPPNWGAMNVALSIDQIQPDSENLRELHLPNYRRALVTER